MTEYEIYSYEAFRRKYEDEIRIVERAEADDLNQDSLLRHVVRDTDGFDHILRGWTNHTFWNSPAFCGTESRH